MVYDTQGQGAAPQPPRRSLRITLAWDGKALVVRRVARIAMLAPGGEGTPPKEGSVGFWVELRDPKGQVLYCRVLHSPIPTHVEIFSPNGIERQAVAPAPIEFDVIAPDYGEGAELVVWSSPLEFEKSLEAARVLGRFDLTKGAGGEREGKGS